MNDSVRNNNLGSAHEGTDHFWQQRLSGLANLFLGTALIVSLTFYGRGDHAQTFAWFSQPWMVAVMIAFIISASWHMKLGANMIINDYIHSEGMRIFFHLLNILISLAVMLAGILALLQILLGDAAPAGFSTNDLMNQEGGREIFDTDMHPPLEMPEGQ